MSREAKNCPKGRGGTAQVVVGEAESRLESGLDVHVPPFSHRLPPRSGASPEMAPDYLSRWGVPWFKSRCRLSPERPGLVNAFQPPAAAGRGASRRRYQPAMALRAPPATAAAEMFGRLCSSRLPPSLRAGAIWWKVEQSKQRRARRWKSFRWVRALPPSCAV